MTHVREILPDILNGSCTVEEAAALLMDMTGASGAGGFVAGGFYGMGIKPSTRLSFVGGQQDKMKKKLKKLNKN